MPTNHRPCGRRAQARTRREFLCQATLGFGALAAGELLAREAVGDEPSRAANPLAPRQPPRAGQARHVIFIFLTGGPSQI
ncbi:MAG: hypothetical protein K1X74_22265, partial [Pirellulales bacterium]|nr:hypothetical protein [Pirellulales bacterium]